MPFLKLQNNNEYYYEIHGQGQPMVLIAGYSSDHLSWLPLVEILAANYQMLIFDNNGVGQTKYFQEDFSIDGFAEEIMELISSLNFSDAILVGHSMGGAIALTLARQHAQNFSKLFLVNTAAKFSTLSQWVLANSIALQKADVEMDLVIENILPWIFSNEFLGNKKAVDMLMENYKSNPFLPTPEANAKQLTALIDFDARAWLKEIDLPTTVITAKHDLLTFPEAGAYLAAHIANAQLLEVPGGHGSIIEIPQHIADIIKGAQK